MTAKYMFYRKDRNESENEKRLFARDELIFNVTEDLLVIMEDKNISKTTLAKKLGKSKSHISQILAGTRNMTLGSLSDICFALGFKPEIKLPVDIEIPEENVWTPREKITKESKAVSKETMNRIPIDLGESVYKKEAA